MDDERDERIVISSSAAISPEVVAGKGFTTVLRGYQPGEVRQFLKRVADDVAAAAAREAELRHALHEAQNRAAHPELDEAALTSSLGEHAGRLIASARETAAAITAEAERTAAATLRDAEYRIARIRQEADTLMARRVDEADGVSASLRQSAEADARAVRDQAQAEAEAAIQAARSHGKEMVAEARAVRERMLGDLARRRRVAEVQLEQLRVARERLVQAYDVVRRTLEEVTAELAAAEPEARLAAEAVGRRLSDADAHPPLRIAEPPLRMASGGGGTSMTSQSSGPGSIAPLRRPEPPTRPTEAGSAPAFETAPIPPAYNPASFQPSQPAPPPASAPDAPVSGRPERPPVPPGWIERAGRSSHPGPTPPPPPPIAGPVLVPAAGIGAGHPPEPVFDPADPGTWAGAGFGLPRDKGRLPEPGPPPGGSHAEPGAHPPPSPAASAAQAPAAPARPAVRPQTVADSVPHGRMVPAPGPTIPAGADAAPPAAGRTAPSTSSTGLRPIPPDLPLEVPPAAPEQPPELSTSEQPAVTSSPPGPAPVDELFARLRHQQPEAQPHPEAAAGKPPGPTDEVVEESALAQRDQRLDTLDADLTRTLKRILQDEQNEVLERLREGGQAGASTLLIALDQQTSAFTAAAAPVLAAAYRAGGAEPDDTTGFALGGKLANDVTAPLRERLERVVAAAGDDQEELAEAVRAAYRQAKLQEIEQLVRHHTAAAHAQGAYASTAPGALQRWVVDDEGPCPDCHDNTLAGPTPKGEPYPTGQDHPPAHLGCRCLLVPVAT